MGCVFTPKYFTYFTNSVSADQPGTIRCHAGLNWCPSRTCPASFVFVLHTSTCAHRGWLVFQMYTCALIYTVCWCHTWDHIQWHKGYQWGERGISCQKDTYLPCYHADLSSVLVRAVWTGEHRKGTPVGLVEPPNICLWDAQNQIRKAAFLS